MQAPIGGCPNWDGGSAVPDAIPAARHLEGFAGRSIPMNAAPEQPRPLGGRSKSAQGRAVGIVAAPVSGKRRTVRDAPKRRVRSIPADGTACQRRFLMPQRGARIRLSVPSGGRSRTNHPPASDTFRGAAASQAFAAASAVGKAGARFQAAS